MLQLLFQLFRIFIFVGLIFRNVVLEYQARNESANQKQKKVKTGKPIVLILSEVK